MKYLRDPLPHSLQLTIKKHGTVSASEMRCQELQSNIIRCVGTPKDLIDSKPAPEIPMIRTLQHWWAHRVLGCRG